MEDQSISQETAPLVQNEGIQGFQRDFSCLHGQVTFVLDQQERCWISLPSACQVLGLNARGQQQRIYRTPELASGLCQLLLLTRGGPQRVNCFQVEFLSLWLQSLKHGQQDLHERFLQDVTVATTTLLKQRESAVALPMASTYPQSRKNKVVVQEPVVCQLPLPLDEINDEPEEHQQVVVATTLPGLSQVLIVTNHPEDRAIREATLARADAWKEEPTRRRPYYIASNEVRVSLGDPAHPLIVEDAQMALRNLQESTVLAARYILGRWHIARDQDSLAREGSVLIRPEELLEWRGILPHSREVYPGSLIRQIDGYEQKYLDQIHQDIKSLELFHLQGQHRILAGGQMHVLTIDGPYLRATQVQEAESGQAMYFVAPGGWINVWIAATEANGGLWVAELDRRIFQLHPHNDQIALRLAFFLTEHWQMHLAANLEVVPLRMEELLMASMISIDRANLTLRFAPRVEAAIQKLVEQGIIGQARPQQSLVKRGHWGKAWLAMFWEITPPEEVVKRYYAANRDRQAPPVLLPSPRVVAQALPSPRKPRRKKEGTSNDAQG